MQPAVDTSIFQECRWYSPAFPNDTPDILAAGDFPNEFQGLFTILSNHQIGRGEIADLLRAHPPKRFAERYDALAYQHLSSAVRSQIDDIDLIFSSLNERVEADAVISESELNQIIETGMRHIAEIKRALRQF